MDARDGGVARRGLPDRPRGVASRRGRAPLWRGVERQGAVLEGVEDGPGEAPARPARPRRAHGQVEPRARDGRLDARARHGAEPDRPLARVRRGVGLPALAAAGEPVARLARARPSQPQRRRPAAPPGGLRGGLARLRLREGGRGANQAAEQGQLAAQAGRGLGAGARARPRGARRAVRRPGQAQLRPGEPRGRAPAPPEPAQLPVLARVVGRRDAARRRGVVRAARGALHGPGLRAEALRRLRQGVHAPPPEARLNAGRSVRTCPECLAAGRRAPAAARRTFGTRMCAVCGREFEATHWNQRRCPGCVARHPKWSAELQRSLERR